MKLETVIKELNKLKWGDVAIGTGISYDTIRNIAKGHTERPFYGDVIKIIEFLEKESNGRI